MFNGARKIVRYFALFEIVINHKWTIATVAKQNPFQYVYTSYWSKIQKSSQFEYLYFPWKWAHSGLASGVLMDAVQVKNRDYS